MGVRCMGENEKVEPNLVSSLLSLSDATRRKEEVEEMLEGHSTAPLPHVHSSGVSSSSQLCVRLF